jgi:hypothetical protein
MLAKPVVRQGRKATGFRVKQPGCSTWNRLSFEDRPVFFMNFWDKDLLGAKNWGMAVS